MEETRTKEEKYKGRSVAELKKLGVRETAAFLPSRSRRSIMRHFEIVEKFIKDCEEKESRKKRIRTHLRDIVIVPHLVGKNIAVYTGKEFKDVLITHEMIGHRLGEFALTREKVTHSAAGLGATKGSRALKK